MPDCLATLDANAVVIQDPANASNAPGGSLIARADPTGKLAVGWLPTGAPNGVAAPDGFARVEANGLVVRSSRVVGARQPPVPDPMGGGTIDFECRDSVMRTSRPPAPTA